MNRLTLRFKDPVIAEEYRNLGFQSNSKDFQLTLLFLIIFILSSGIPELVEGRLTSLYISLASMFALVLLGICFRFSGIIRKYSMLLALLIMYIFNFTKLIFVTIGHDKNSIGLYYLRGYTLGTFEVVLILRFLEMWQKCFGVFAGFCLRVASLAVINSSVLLVGVFRIAVLDLFTLFVLWAAEKKEKEVFINFYRYREGKNKFKELLVDYLPQSVLVIDEKVSRVLFYNSHFANLFDEPECLEDKAPLSTDGLQVPKVLITLLDIELFTIRDTVSQEILKELSIDNPNLRDVILHLNQKKKLENQTWTCYATYKSGTQSKHFEILLKKIRWDCHDAVTVIFNDITYQENLIALKMADANKDKILATVSHDLRTPLNAIIGILQICESQVADKPEVADYLQLCRDNAYLLLSLVNSILDMQQISQGKLKVIPSRIDIRKVLMDIIKLFQFQAKQNKLKLELKIDQDVPAYIETDESRLKQILINLMANAIKFTLNGVITIQASVNPKDDKYISISVTDTGVGIKEEDRGKLFKMFGKLEDKEGVNKHGIGLGLTIANALSLSLGGKSEGQGIVLESEPGVGSKFTFIILKSICDASNKISFQPTSSENIVPKSGNGQLGGKRQLSKQKLQNELEEMSSNDCIQSKLSTHNFTLNTNSPFELCIGGTQESLTEKFLKSPEQLNVEKNGIMQENGGNCGVNSATSKSILVVDDNSFNLLVAEKILKQLNCSTQTARGGVEAIELVKEAWNNDQIFDLILMDCQMPIMDGYETTKILREMMGKSEVPYIPIIALTANTSGRDIERCFESGMVNYLSKPLMVEQLSQFLQDYT